MSTAMDQAGHPSPPASAGPSRWATRCRWFGRRAIVVVLAGVFLLWAHELFVDTQVRQAWKLKVLMGLIPLGVAGAAALLLAWLMDWQRRRKR